jgi:hypothetical protein
MGARCLGACGFVRVALGVRGGGEMEMGDDGCLKWVLGVGRIKTILDTECIFGFLRGECGAYVRFCMSGILGRRRFFCRICILHLCYCSGVFCDEMDGIESNNFFGTQHHDRKDVPKLNYDPQVSSGQQAGLELQLP